MVLLPKDIKKISALLFFNFIMIDLKLQSIKINIKEN